MLGMPYHVKPPPPRTTPVERVELVGSVKPASPAQVYVVQGGDTLWSIAQHFYGNPLLWSRIYYANQSQIHDPNMIYPGQKFTIPPAGAAGATTRSSSDTPAQASSPTSVTGYLRQAAQGTGLSESVVAAQNYVESSYGQNVGPSSTGAMGPWQFEPYTWGAYSSAPFSAATDWSTSTQAYIAMMRQLLQWSGGNVRQALAAYNAGQGNWQAGLGYADQILSIAGQG
jgi:LysM repeat protein